MPVAATLEMSYKQTPDDHMSMTIAVTYNHLDYAQLLGLEKLYFQFFASLGEAMQLEVPQG